MSEGVKVWLVCECDEEANNVLAGFSDYADAETYQKEMEQKNERRWWYVIEPLSLDRPRDELPGVYVAWTNETLPDVEFATWQAPSAGDGLRMTDGSGRGYGATPEEAVANARRYADTITESTEGGGPVPVDGGGR
jgi:hypothetical protein